MKPNPLTVSPTARFAEIGEKFIATRFNYLYVTEDERFVGAISLHDIKNYLNSPELAELVIAGDILREDFPIIRPDASLSEALERFARHQGERLPVVSEHEGRSTDRQSLENRCHSRPGRQRPPRTVPAL